MNRRRFFKAAIAAAVAPLAAKLDDQSDAGLSDRTVVDRYPLNAASIADATWDGAVVFENNEFVGRGTLTLGGRSK